jgi:hypothetical protein
MSNAIFDGYGKVQAELSNGEIIECETSLLAFGYYDEQWNQITEIGGEWEVDQRVDEETVIAQYPDEFECDVEYKEDVIIKNILKLIDDIEWEVQDGWNEPDEDAA